MAKILIVSGTPIISGAEYVLSDYLKNTKHTRDIEILHSDVEAVNSFYSQFECRTYKTKLLNPVGVVGNGKLNLIKKLYRFGASSLVFYNIFRKNEIKTVLGNNTGDVIYSLYSSLFGKKHINYIHDMIEKDSLIAKSILFFDKFVYKYIAVSNAVKKNLVDIGIDSKKIVVIYNGLESNKSFLYKDISKEITFGFVGNIDDKKNPLEFLFFFKKARAFFKDKKIKGQMVFGNIQDKELFVQIKKYIEQHKLNIELLGRVNREEMKQFYENINFLVVTSKKDSFPTVILEAFNFGVPVIAHNVDGIPEMVEDGYNGFLYNTSDDFEKILRKLFKYNYNELQKNSNLTIKEKFNNLKKIEKLNNELFEWRRT